MAETTQRPVVTLEQEVLEWADSVYEEAEKELNESRELRLTSKLIDYISGQQWAAKARFGRSRPTVNRLFRQFIEMAGLLSDIEPDFQVKFYNEDEEFLKLQELLNEYIGMWARMSDFEAELTQSIMWALVHTGYAKVQWNSALNNGLGDNQYIPLGPLNLMTIGAGSRMQEDECVIARWPVTLESLFRSYGDLALGVQPDLDAGEGGTDTMRPGRIAPSSWVRLNPQLKKLLGVKQPSQSRRTRYPKTMLKQYWFKDNCVSPSTKVLTADLVWKRADEVQAGEELIGCDEETKIVTRNKCRWIRRTMVESVARLRRPSLRIVTDKGVIECSESHRWLASSKKWIQSERKNETYCWKFAGELTIGSKIAFTFKPWETDDSRDAGYLAGLFDGEGWAGKYQVGFAQQTKGDNAITLARGQELLKERGFEINADTTERGVARVLLNGGRAESLRFIGSIRPPRLLAKSARLWENKLLKNKGETAATILSIESIGEQDVIAIQTTEKTFIADGFVSHNSRNETGKTQSVGKYNWRYDVEPGMPLFPRGRFIIIAGGKVLQDSPNPYWHGMFPFAKLRLIRVPWSPHGQSPLEPLAQMSDIINRINGGIMDMIRAAIEPGVVAPKAAFSQSVWDSLDPGAPGAKMQYNNNSPKAPEFRKPPELPNYVLTMKQDVEKEQDATSGASAITQTLQKKQVPGGDSLDMIMNSRSIPIRFMGRGITSFLTDVGTMVVANQMQFSTSKSRIKKWGTKGLTDQDFEPYYGQWINKGWQPEEFVQSVVFEIRKGSLLSIEKNDEVQIATVLRKMGDISRKSLLQKIGLSKAQIEKIEMELKQEAQEKIALGAAAGALTHHGKK